MCTFSSCIKGDSWNRGEVMSQPRGEVHWVVRFCCASKKGRQLKRFWARNSPLVSQQQGRGGCLHRGGVKDRIDAWSSVQGYFKYLSSESKLLDQTFCFGAPGHIGLKSLVHIFLIFAIAGVWAEPGKHLSLIKAQTRFYELAGASSSRLGRGGQGGDVWAAWRRLGLPGGVAAVLTSPPNRFPWSPLHCFAKQGSVVQQIVSCWVVTLRVCLCVCVCL